MKQKLSFFRKYPRTIGTIMLLTPLIGGGVLYAMVTLPGSDADWIGPHSGVSQDVTATFDANWQNMSCSNGAPPAPTGNQGGGGGGGGGGSSGGSAS